MRVEEVDAKAVEEEEEAVADPSVVKAVADPSVAGHSLPCAGEIHVILSPVLNVLASYNPLG